MGKKGTLKEKLKYDRNIEIMKNFALVEDK